MNNYHIVYVLFQVMFEKYGFAGVYCAIQAVLTLYAQGKKHEFQSYFNKNINNMLSSNSKSAYLLENCNISAV